MDLAKLVASPAVVRVGGEAVEVSPVRVRELEAFAQALAPLVGALAAGDIDIPRLVMTQPRAIIDAVAIGTRKPREWVEGLGLDDLVNLAGEVAAVNGDFFVRAVVPAIGRALERIGGAMPIGSTLPPV